MDNPNVNNGKGVKGEGTNPTRQMVNGEVRNKE